MLMMKNIVITGLGVVTPNAIGCKEFLKALQNGVSGIDEIRSFDTRDYPVHRGGEVKGLETMQLGTDVSSFGRTSRMAVGSVREALEDAGLNDSNMDPKRAGVIIGTTSGEVQAIEAIDEAWATKSELPTHLYRDLACGIVASNISTVFGLEGPTIMIANACSSGNFAISFGCDLIRQGHADVIIAGGADSFSKVALSGFSRVHAVAPEVCQPFDKNRKGIMVGEGSGIVILEESRSAARREAKIYATVLGSGIGCDAFHLTAPDPVGMAKVMRLALADATLDPCDIDYISAHGTGTVANDAAETAAIKAIFKDKATFIPVSSIKSMIGHTMGAASAIEMVACCLSLRHGFIPPTINFQEPDPECDLDYVPNSARHKNLRNVMNNSFAFGGNNASVILGRRD
jgi:3-oxoacyl-[acyl-carrier-protein] synthase II